MLPEIGVFLLVIAFGMALMQASFLLPLRSHRAQVGLLMPGASWLQSLCISLSLAVLVGLRLENDFSVSNVIQHSNLHLPVLYKIVGAWGNHEGSMLLWVWVLAAYGLILSLKAKPENGPETAIALAVQSLLSAGFLAFILFTSNPFARQYPPPADGQALNPLLQDVALAMHPPLLYLGYVGFSMVFSLGVARLLCAAPDERGGGMRAWAQALHPWIMFAWASLTLGIGLGSWWAYRELGWGGWWFWDPVENASLLPWLAGTALLHANAVLKKRGLLGQWVVLLSIVTFALSLLGTFLVRSGVLTSVHGFASDPARGLFILGFMAASIGGGLLLFALRGHRVETPGKALPLSREGFIIINNLFILSACAVVLLGTLYPLAVEWINDGKLTVGPAFYNATFLPLMALPLLAAGIAPFLPWKKAGAGPLLKRLQPPALAALAALAIVLSVTKTQPVFAAAGFGLAAWLGVASLGWFYGARRGRGAWPLLLAHAGMAIFIIGVTGVSLWKESAERPLSPGQELSLAGYVFSFESHQPLDTPNYTGNKATIVVHDTQGRRIAQLEPEFRRYGIRGMATSEASIHSTLFYDLYAVIGESSPDGKRISSRFYYIPLPFFLWLGFALMAAGGMAGVWGERLRHD